MERWRDGKWTDGQRGGGSSNTALPLCPLSAVHCPHTMSGEPCLLWSASDMEPRADGRYRYVPTQLYPSLQQEDMPQHLPSLAIRRLRMMSAVDNTNDIVGSIYIGNCVEPMAWAGEHVGYIIDASNGIPDVIYSDQLLPFHLQGPTVPCPTVPCPLPLAGLHLQGPTVPLGAPLPLPGA